MIVRQLIVTGLTSSPGKHNHIYIYNVYIYIYNIIHHASGTLIKPAKPQPPKHGKSISVGLAWQAISLQKVYTEA